MGLYRMTLTGADDSVTPEAACLLLKDYPFAELGILASASCFPVGRPRFPSEKWARELVQIAIWTGNKSLSAHLCGRWVRGLLEGTVPDCAPFNYPQFQRIQLNFHKENPPYDADFWEALNALQGKTPRQFIFQTSGIGLYLSTVLAYKEMNAVPLFDASGGAGILPIVWPKPFVLSQEQNTIAFGTPNYVPHGYAGGLSPDNLAGQLPRILDAAGDCRIWIDAETHLRSDGGLKFDLDKCRRFLDIAAGFIEKTP